MPTSLVFTLLLPLLQKVYVHLSVWRVLSVCPVQTTDSSFLQHTMAAIFKFNHEAQTPLCTWHTSNRYLPSRREGLCGLNRKHKTSAGHYPFSLHYPTDRLSRSHTSHHHQSVASLSTHIDSVFCLLAN